MKKLLGSVIILWGTLALSHGPGDLDIAKINALPIFSIYKFTTPEQLDAYIHEIETAPKASSPYTYLKGHRIKINNINKKGCLKVVSTLEKYYKDFNPTAKQVTAICSPNPDRPVTELFLVTGSSEQEVLHSIKFNTEDPNTTISKLAQSGLVLILPQEAVEANSPQSATYNQNDLTDPTSQQMRSHSAYVPFSLGAGEKITFSYQSTNNGFGEFQSTTYSAFVSTFFVKYNATPPVINYNPQSLGSNTPSGGSDLLLGPVIKTVMYEAFSSLETQIKDNDDTVLGSKILGVTSLFLLNPVHVIDNSINSTIKESPGLSRYFSSGEIRIIREDSSEFTWRPDGNNSQIENDGIGVGLIFNLTN